MRKKLALVSVSLLFLFLISFDFKFDNTKKIVMNELIKNDGTVAITAEYTTEGKKTIEQHILIKRSEEFYTIKILIDPSSYFVNNKGFNWPDTTITISKQQVEQLAELEKKIFDNAASVTYNCNISGSNSTNLIFYYDKSPEGDIEWARIGGVNNYYYKGFTKGSLSKSISVNGGFFSLRDELLNLGKSFERCKY